MSLESFAGLVKRLVRVLNRSGLDYMLTGALAASYYGRPRTTLDADIIIATEEKDLTEIARWLAKAGLKVNKERLQAAWRSDYRIATLEDEKSPHTVDVIFTNQRLERSVGRVAGLRTYYETPESLILSKLRMLKVTTQAERAVTDRGDIKSILENTSINMRSLRKRAKTQKTARLLDDLLASCVNSHSKSALQRKPGS